MAADSLDLEALGAELICYEDSYEHVGTVDMFVYDLKAQWEKEKERTRILVTKEDAWVSIEKEVDVPPAVVWDHLTKIDVKRQLLGFTDASRTDDLGGRIDVESTFHCAHGEFHMRYKIVDWKPFEYLTCYETSLINLVYYFTYQMLPSDTGTHFSAYVSYPESNPSEEKQKDLQGLWDYAFSNFKPFLEESFAKSTQVLLASQ